MNGEEAWGYLIGVLTISGCALSLCAIALALIAGAVVGRGR